MSEIEHDETWSGASRLAHPPAHLVEQFVVRAEEDIALQLQDLDQIRMLAQVLDVKWWTIDITVETGS
jgi:hypothetical protein